jgi:HSP20 family protein
MNMDLVKWEPFKELATMRAGMDRLMDSLFNIGTPLKGLWAPDLDISETDEEVLVKADLPGIDEKDLSVSLSGNNLLIKGEKKEEKEEKGKHFHRIERSFGGFQRMVALPVGVDADRIRAEYNKGVLEVHLPKKPEAKPHQIPVKANK